MPEEIRYIHSEQIHTLASPGSIVPQLINIFHPQSVIDVGCGIGTFLHVFLEHGIKDVTGIDGKWVDRKKLMIPTEHFMEKNLEEDFRMNRKYELVVCLEVAEHLSEEKANAFIKNLTQLGDKIVFSAATVNQGGQNHINEQHTEYWIQKFSEQEFLFYDIFRNQFWDNKEIDWWYKQNMFLVAHKSVDVKQYIPSSNEFKIYEHIHPELLAYYAERNQHLQRKINNLLEGKSSGKLYVEMMKKKLLNIFRR